MRHLLVRPVDGQCVHGEVVGADGEEIRHSRQRVRGECRTRHFDHDTDGRQMTADIHKLVADELEKIEQQSQPVWGNRYGSHVTDRTLTAAESRYVRLGAESPSPIKASEKADADLVTEGSEEDVEGEPKGDGAVEGEAGVDKPHGTKVVATRRETPMSPTWYDAGRERRVAKLGKLKRRGKGPPKKGSGKRSK